MFQFIPVDKDDIYALRVSGKLNHEDYLEFLPRLEDLVKPDEKIALLIELDDFYGADLAAIKDDYTFYIKHSDAFKKIAIVGDKKWHKWMTLLSSPFIKGKIKYFNRIDFKNAWDWLRKVKYSNEELANMPIKSYQRIMACIDFSPHSKHALRRAIKIARENKSQLLLVNVVDESILYDLDYDPVGGEFSLVGSVGFTQAGMENVDALILSLIEKAKNQMTAIIEELDLDQEQGVVLSGRPNTTLVSFAEAQNVDLIVMGTQGKRGMDAVLGSSTRYLQAHARCEVLSVPLVD